MELIILWIIGAIFTFGFVFKSEDSFSIFLVAIVVCLVLWPIILIYNLGVIAKRIIE